MGRARGRDWDCSGDRHEGMLRWCEEGEQGCGWPLLVFTRFSKMLPYWTTWATLVVAERCHVSGRWWTLQSTQRLAEFFSFRSCSKLCPRVDPTGPLCGPASCWGPRHLGHVVPDQGLAWDSVTRLGASKMSTCQMSFQLLFESFKGYPFDISA